MRQRNAFGMHLLLILLLSAVSVGTFTDCGGKFEGPSGVIVSPNYPSSYPNNARCNWTITAQPNEIIDLKLPYLDLDGYLDSCPDVVTIYDGDNSRATPIQQLCRYKNETELSNLQIRSTGNKVFVTFTSNAINRRSGFLIMYYTHMCPEMMYGTPNCNKYCSCNTTNTAYCNNLNGTCYCKNGWTSSGCDIDVDECADPHVESCTLDYQMCFNFEGGFSCDCKPGLMKNSDNICSAKLSPRCTIQCSHECGVTDNLTQICYCPYTMKLNGLNCIACPPMTYGSNCARKCQCNAAQTTECNRVTGQCICKSGWSGATCDQDVDECHLVQYLNTCSSVYNQRCINTIGSYLCNCLDGFVHTTPGVPCEKRTCDYNLTATQGLIQSPNYPTEYWANADCSWFIQVDTKSTVSVNFSTFQTETGYDYVYFYDGPNDTSRLLAVFSGTKLFSDPIRSTGSSMFIRFTSDGYSQFKGFNGLGIISSYPQGCSYTVLAREEIQIIGTSQTSGNPSFVKRIFCYWLVSAPSGTDISLNFFTVSTDSFCQSFVAVYQGAYVHDSELIKYCGTQNPGVIRIQGPNVYIVYQSEEDTQRSGFQVRVNYCRPFYYGSELCTYPCSCVQANSISCDSLSGACFCKSGWTSATCAVDIDECLQTPCSLTERCINMPGSYLCQADCEIELNGPVGVIHTVQFPNYSLYNAKCNWTIHGRNNQVVSLSIGFKTGEFQLVESTYCNEGDSLDIYDGEIAPANQIGKYCGTRIPSVFRSTTKKMILQLRTTHGSRRGFMGLYYTHECKDFTYGLTCERSCSCQRSNTEFCGSLTGICVCNVGWAGTNCDEDVDECRAGKCLENEVCENTPGSFICSCRVGFVRNSANICEGANASCTLSSGKRCSHYCTMEANRVVCICPDGMELTGVSDELCVVSLYPFGSSIGDFNIYKNSLRKVSFDIGVPFGDSVVTTAFIHGSGAITFDDTTISTYPTHDPSKLIIEAFWANMKPLMGQVYYHLYEKCEPSMFSESDHILSPAKQIVMERARRDVIKMTSMVDFDVNTVLIATWENQVSATDMTNRKNTFQAILICGNSKESSVDQEYSIEETSFVLYLYPKDKMIWVNKDVVIGVSAGPFSASEAVSSRWLVGLKENRLYKVGQRTRRAQQCQRYVCKNSRQIANPVYRQEIEQLYKCPCTLDSLGLQWTLYEQRSPNIYCYAITPTAKKRMLQYNPRNKMCCYKWDKPADIIDWKIWSRQLSLAWFIHDSPDSGFVLNGDPDWYEGVRENIDAHRWCCKDDNSSRLCERFNKIYPDMECSYDVEFVPGFVLAEKSILSMNRLHYSRNGWLEYTLTDISSKNVTIQVKTDRNVTSSLLTSNIHAITAISVKDTFGLQFLVKLSDSNNSMEIFVKDLNLTENFYGQIDYKISFAYMNIVRENSENTVKVAFSFDYGLSIIVRVGDRTGELNIQVLKTLNNETEALLGSFNEETNDAFSSLQTTNLSARWTESFNLYTTAYTIPIEVKTFTVNGSKSIKANYSDSVVLHCEVTGSGGTYAVLSGPELSKFKNVSDNTAVIDKTFANLTCQDAGRYFCWGQNGGGENGSREFVDVNITCLVEPPPVYQGKPYKPEKQITIESEKNTTFQFVVYGYPEPTSYDLRIQTIDNSYSNVTSNKYNVQYIHQEPPFGLVTLTIYDENTKETITYVLGINSEKGRVEVTVEVVKFTKKPAPDDTKTQMAIGIGVGVGGFLIVVVIVVVCTVKYRRSRTPAGSRGMPMDQLYDKPSTVYSDRHYALAYENKIASDYDLPKN